MKNRGERSNNTGKGNRQAVYLGDWDYIQGATGQIMAFTFKAEI